MRILLVVPMPPRAQAPGAIPILLYAELLALQRNNHVTLVTVAGPDPAELEAVNRLLASGVEVHGVRRSVPVGWQRWHRRWRLASMWLWGVYPWRTVWYWASGMQRVLDRLTDERQYDLIQVEDSAAGAYRYPAGITTIYTEHEVRRPKPVDWRGWSWHGDWYWILGEADWKRWRRYQISLWRRFDCVQVFSERDAAAMRELAPELVGKIRINPFPVGPTIGNDSRSEEHGHVLFVGNFTHKPNVDAALWLGCEIMPLLRARFPEVRLTIVGTSPPVEVLALAAPDIHVTGEVPIVEPYLRRAAVVVAPIRIGGGMRMKVLQAMAHGKAVVATPRGVEGLVTLGAPPLLVADEAESFAELTAGLLNDDDARRALGARAHAFVAEHLSPEAYGKRQETIYAEFLSERNTE